MPLQVTGRITIPDSELEERFIRASGPGGQHVNKAETGVQLRFAPGRSTALPAPVARRLMQIAGARLTAAGEILIEADSERSQHANRQAARRRLADLIRRAAIPPRTRRPTRPSRAAKRRRLEAKKQRGRRKHLRKAPPGDTE